MKDVFMVQPTKDFQPITISLTFESLDEIEEFWVRHNVSNAVLRNIAQTACRLPTGRTVELNDVDLLYDLWKAVDTFMRENYWK